MTRPSGGGSRWLVGLAAAVVVASAWGAAHGARELPIGSSAVAPDALDLGARTAPARLPTSKGASYGDMVRLGELLGERPLEAVALMVERSGKRSPRLDYVMARSFEAQGRPEQALLYYRRAAARFEPGELRDDANQRRAAMEAALDEKRALPVSCPANRPALFALEGPGGVVRLDRRAVLVVHGYGGTPADLHAITERARLSGEQVFVACYRSRQQTVRESGHQVASMIYAIRRLQQGNAQASKELILVGHSLGGLVSRMALNELALMPPVVLAGWSSIRFIAVDSPWHGYAGPGDGGIEASFFRAVSPLLPRGMWQMRARSVLFTGDPASADPVERAGIFGVTLPDHVRVELVFANEGEDIMSYRDGVLRGLPAELVAWYRRDQPLGGDARLLNFWRALQSASSFPSFSAAMHDLDVAGRLDEQSTLALLERYYPIYPGNHSSILHDSHEEPGFVDHLLAYLVPADAGLTSPN